MNKFIENISNIFDTINKDNSKTYMNTLILSKQYLAYYLYRIFCKYIIFFENVSSTSQINDIYKMLKIPSDNKKQNLCYPLYNKMINDEKLLNLFIVSILSMMSRLDKYISTLPNISAYTNFIEFINSKDIDTIIQDLVDLQKLLPGLSISAIPP